MLKVKDIEFSYKNNKVLNNVSFNSDYGYITTILGKNGSGKTTLIKIINRLLKPQRGDIFIENKKINKLKRYELSKKIGYCPQYSYIPETTVFETILAGKFLQTRWFINKKDIESVNEIIDFLGLTNISFKSINQISGGELQKVIIARAIISKPKILLLDEPINHLDIKNQHEIMQLLYKITKALNINTIIVLHDINIALRYGEKFIVLKNGHIIVSGDKKDITENIIKEAYNINVKIIDFNGIPLVVPFN